ncbi:putative LRR receptor-like serine/threonine-protein kinase At3g47570 [Apium graveolens]|uniref:putative LRR receptor-like serine/threonine-protein kinase At3g47570 n=1 Tax=Apium graveolens TaxID=4045 RepID=UPI003D7B160F
MLFDIGVKCAMEVPRFRPCIGDTLSKLKRVRSIYMDPNLITLSYKDLHEATDGFFSSNLVGEGGFGSVYKGTSNDIYFRSLLRNSGIEDAIGKPFAIKVFKRQRRGASKSFNTEYQILRDIHHPNVIKMITACTSEDEEGHNFRAILYEFMDHGSLEMWLHPKDKNPCDGPIKPQLLSLLARINIAIDVACALNYLHHQGVCCIIHCDLKPGNILLDKNMVAHIADFGLAISLPEFLNYNLRSSSTGIRGTTGYVAPEYGLGSQMTTKGDTYSFGILLLEMLIGKKPTHRSFCGGINIHYFVSMALLDDVTDIADPLMEVMTSVTEGDGKQVKECLTRMFNIGLKCSRPSPMDRPDMHAVLHELESIRNNFQVI